jgi:elongation factor 1-beta
MGNVAVSMRIMPESPDVDLEKLKKEISKKIKIQDSKIEPIAFGLKALKLMVIIPDASGTDSLERDIRSIKGVGEVEIDSVTLL